MATKLEGVGVVKKYIFAASLIGINVLEFSL